MCAEFEFCTLVRCETMQVSADTMYSGFRSDDTVTVPVGAVLYPSPQAAVGGLGREGERQHQAAVAAAEVEDEI